MIQEPEKDDYSRYDIPLEDLRRWRTLPPAVILQWLEDVHEFSVKVVRPNLKGYRINGRDAA